MIPNFSRVDEQIYRSGILDKSNITEILSYNIKSVISMKMNQTETEFEKDFCTEHNITHFHIPINLIEYSCRNEENFWSVFYAMQALQKPLLVHCTHGKDRTGIAIALWRRKVSRWSHDRIIDEMEDFGFNPIFWYWKQFFVRRIP